MQFQDLNLSQPILNALIEEGYTNPTPIQEKAIPIVLSGKDLMGVAQTGTGKTAAFAIPIIELLNKRPGKIGPGQIRSLIVTPTRELAIQIDESFKAYGKNTELRTTVIFGGVKQFKHRTLLLDSPSLAHKPDDSGDKR
jgi:ATP-dependent RNA helicase RhlE